jgi:hydroxyethylthiazole kinase-like uncharacterized protein yjeF
MDTPTPPSFHAQGHAPETRSPPIASRPTYEISVENARELDRLAVEQFGIPSIVLMENAAIALREHALSMLKDARNRSIIIFAGPGNNAGDGFALARHLANHTLAPTIVTTHPQSHYAGDAKTNLDIITKMNLQIIDARSFLGQPHPPPGLIIDALFGTGLARPITGIASQLIAQISASKEAGAQVLAVDVPSGLNAQTGNPMGESIVIADRTVTFAALKEGLSSIEAQPYTGEIHIAPISIPHQLLNQIGHRLNHPLDK